MSLIALRVPNEMKKEMAHVKINWSEYLRQSIQEALESEKKRGLIQKMQHMLVGEKRTPRGTAARLVRKMRDHA